MKYFIILSIIRIFSFGLLSVAGIRMDAGC